MPREQRGRSADEISLGLAVAGRSSSTCTLGGILSPVRDACKSASEAGEDSLRAFRIKLLGKRKSKARCETGWVYEQRLRLRDEQGGG